MTAFHDFIAPFGESLFSPSSATSVKTGNSLTGKTVMLYFSAHWCPPCRRFTPKLIEFYNTLKSKSSDTELVFISLDKTETEYNDYTKDMPWLCLPFDKKSESSALANKYKAEGIPHLVIVNENGEVITMEGTSEVNDDPEGKKFPWTPKTFSESWPQSVLTKKGKVESSSFDDKYLMLYFSAHWCPPCRGFTPVLSAAYTKLKRERDDFELVFVSSDKDQKSFDEYFSEMTFWALPFEHRDEKNALSKLFDIQGIPSLLILGPVPAGGGNRPVINTSLRGIIEGGDFSDFPFHPKPYKDFTTDTDSLGGTKSLVILNEYGDDDEQSETVDLVKAVAETLKDKGIDSYYAIESKNLVPKVRTLCKIESKTDEAVMILLDIPDNGGYYVSDDKDITVEGILKFVETPGERKQFGQ